MAAPNVSLPKGGGAIRGIGEKFNTNLLTGTASLSVPLAVSAGRSAFGPQLTLSYDSGSGNGPFGFGWSLSTPSITRKTDKGLPRYLDAVDSDEFVLSGSEDLVPVYRQDPGGTWVAAHPNHTRDSDGDWVRDASGDLLVHEDDVAGHRVRRYRPRVEGLFARIERWSAIAAPDDVHWRSITKDNVLTIYGLDAESRIADPLDASRIFSWLICETRDDKGNVVLHRYKAEGGEGIDVGKPQERNRGARDDARRTANRYPKRVLYGNRTPALDAVGDRPHFLDPQVAAGGWMFELVFDYGDHDPAAPTPVDDEAVDGGGDLQFPWKPRPDPFSSYRAGYEVRTARACRRALMFHHFPGTDAEGVGVDCLVRSTDFTYGAEVDPTTVDAPFHTFLREVTHCGYRRQGGGYDRRTLPPLEFEYSAPVVQDEVEEVDPGSVENLPAGLDGTMFRWADLHGEGVSGALAEQGDGWFYKRNLSPLPVRGADGSEQVKARFSPLEPVAVMPNVALSGGAQLMDLAGDGLVDVVVMDGPTPGLYEHDEAEGWQPFRPFTAVLNRDLDDRNSRMVDLDGDGLADVLVTEDSAFVWHRSLAEAGYGAAEHVATAVDEERGPRVVFADSTQSIHLADLSGDGLSDIVRIRNGEVCYWPNLGHGRFGAKVAMENAPWFDNPDAFDFDRVRLADIDGSGTTDIVYLHRDGVRLYFNQSGNSWSRPRALTAFPNVDEAVKVMTADLLGNGTTCLVWSSPLAGDTGRPMRFVNLIGRTKPHLMVRTANNLGAETRITYAPSTKFYLRDKSEGRPWIARLPFPVHVVEQMETYDHVSRNRFTTRYAYHHGRYDGAEREFCGFGMVEQWDTAELEVVGGPLDANASAESDVPPVRTKSWFHTGAHLGRERVSRQYEDEYFREPGLTVAGARDLLLDDTPMPPGLDAEAEREACRALKGSLLRSELYADDAGPAPTAGDLRRAALPYSVTEQNLTIRAVQPRGANRHGVFDSHPRETLTFNYERNGADPRVQHVLTLEVDGFGTVLKEATVAYGRRATIRTVDAQGGVQQVPNPGLAALDLADRTTQTTALVTYAENRLTNAIDEQGARRNPILAEATTFELTGYTPSGPLGRFRADDLVEPDPNDPDRLRHRFQQEVDYEAGPVAGQSCRRIVERLRTLYRSDDLTALLPLGELQPHGIVGESYKLAFTPGLLGTVFVRPRAGQPPEALLPNPAAVLAGQAGDRGGYLASQTLKADGRFPATDKDDHWWLASGRSFFSPGSADPPAVELASARQHFFVSRRYTNPFGQHSIVDYDADDVLLVEKRDPLGNRMTVQENDYRVLQPRLVADPNRNRTEVAFDALGMVVATAVMGKAAPAPVEGDSLQGFVADLTQAQLDAFFAGPDAAAPALLADATTRVVYDLDRFRRTRRQNPGNALLWQPVGAATLARETHAAEPAPPGGTRIQISFSYSDGFAREIQRKAGAEPAKVNGVPGPRRWAGSGWTVFNNKGKPVRQFEPFFSATPAFEFGAATGVSAVAFYDPLDRVVVRLRPDRTYEKLVVGPWQHATYDGNDTCAARNQETGDPRTDPDVRGYVAGFFAALPAAPAWETWHAARVGGALGPHEAAAATRAAAHADTPTTAVLDPLGRTFLTVTRNRVVCPGHDLDGTEETLFSRVELDIEGNQREVRDAIVQAGDALGRVVSRYSHDMLGSLVHEASMDAGSRWILNDVVGNPIRAWDDRGHNVVTTYDGLRRQTQQTVRGTTAASDPRTLNRDVVVDRIEYGEAQPNAEARNLRSRVRRHFDSAGVVTNEGANPATGTVEAFDFKGNALRTTRQLASDYAAVPDWSQNPQLDAETFSRSFRYDALNRPTQILAPHSSLPRARRDVIQPSYNEANLLDRLDVWLERAGEPAGVLDPAADAPSAPGVADVDYDAKGRRTSIDLKNGTTTFFEYDPLSFQLARLYTRRGPAFTADCDNPQPPPATVAAPDQPPVGVFCGLQNLGYTYDPSGNVTHIEDGAQQPVFFRNQRVDPSNDYTYDALYRLIEADGREHLGQQANGTRRPPTRADAGNAFHAGQAHPGDGNAMGTYTERFVYDAVGNILELQHRGSDPAHAGWTRAYDHTDVSRVEDGAGGAPAKTGNRLTATTVDPGGPTPTVEPYAHDAHGNVVRMPHLGGGAPGEHMHWDHRDRLRRVDLGGGGTVHYTYDAGGQRTRKVWEKAPGLTEERIYLGGFEVFRKHGAAVDAAAATFERLTLHLADGERRMAMVETRTVDVPGTDPGPARLTRYQLANHLGSATVELDDAAQVISYEEHAPYGSTTYQAVRSQTEAPKRHRYTGKERDEETGLCYHGARYLAPWLGRWTATDPAGLKDGPNLYAYVKGNPIRAVDPTGTQGNDVKDVADDAIKKLDDLDQPFAIQGKGYRETALTMDIDEPNPVGEKGLKPDVARARALDPNNRQLLDPVTNRTSKHLGVDPKGVPAARAPVSVTGDPSVLVTRRFSEITEMQDVFNEALAKIKEPGKLSPTALKDRINGYVWDVIKNSQSESAQKVRAALNKLGFENVPGKGFVMRKVEMPPEAQAAAKAKAGGRAFQFVKWGGRVLLVVGVASDAVEVYYAENKAKTITKKVGFWTGAWAGAKGGAWAGARIGAAGAVVVGQLGPQVAAPEEIVTAPVAGLVGGIIGGIGGGIVGGFAGETITETVYEWTFEKR